MNFDRYIHFHGAAIVGGFFLIAFLAAPTSLPAQGGMRPPLTTQFIDLKRAEWVAYQCHVSDWELRRYAAAF